MHAIHGPIENRPVAQGVHVVAPGSVAVSVTDPAAQFVQVVLPVEAEKDPAEQSMHSMADANGWYLPASHSMQSATDVLPIVAPY